MPSPTNLVNDLARRALAARAPWLAAALALAACGGSDTAAVDAPAGVDAQVACNPSNPAPTYTELFNTYFAPNTAGHCATAGCHADPDHNVWLCGTDKATCYQGMVTEGLINTANPVASLLSDPNRSPLIWVDPAHGFMPADRLQPNPAGAAAINAWALACAQNN